MYVVYNKLETTPIVINNAVMIPQSTSSYLAFVKKSRDVNIQLKTRINKAKRATFAVMSMLRKLPYLRPIQIQVLKCTVQATMAYGIEA